ncbi:MAG: hypothetical protein V4608_01770 [Bacteroidota bacterium]
MQKVNTLAELKAEQKNLEVRKVFLEGEIKNNFEALKAELAPLTSIKEGAKTILTSPDNSTLGNSVGSVVDFVAKKVILKNSGFLVRLIVPYIAKNLTANIVEKNKSTIVDLVSSFLSKLKQKKEVKVGG